MDRVIPMLPQRLSNGICSLNEGEDRLALSCLMDIDTKGNVVSHKIAETVIRVTKRMSYTQVKEILEDRDEERIREFKKLVPCSGRWSASPNCCGKRESAGERLTLISRKAR